MELQEINEILADYTQEIFFISIVNDKIHFHCDHGHLEMITKIPVLSVESVFYYFDAYHQIRIKSSSLNYIYKIIFFEIPKDKLLELMKGIKDFLQKLKAQRGAGPNANLNHKL